MHEKELNIQEHKVFFEETFEKIKNQLKIDKKELLNRFLFVLNILEDRKNVNKSLPFIFTLNELYKKIARKLPAINFEIKNDLLFIKENKLIIFDKNFGVVHSSEKINKIKFSKDHEKILHFFIS